MNIVNIVNIEYLLPQILSLVLHPLTFSAFQSERQIFCHTVAADVDVRSVWLMNIQGSK